jgi:hypothetical protein
MLIVVGVLRMTSPEDEEGSHRKLESSARRQKLLFKVIMFFTFLSSLVTSGTYVHELPK